MYRAKTDCFYSSARFPSGAFFREGQRVPDDLVDPEKLPDFLEEVPSIAPEAPPAPPSPQTLRELQEDLERGTPGQDFLSRAPRPPRKR